MRRYDKNLYKTKNWLGHEGRGQGKQSPPNMITKVKVVYSFSGMPCSNTHYQGYLHSDTMYVKLKKQIIDKNVKPYMGIINTKFWVVVIPRKSKRKMGLE